MRALFEEAWVDQDNSLAGKNPRYALCLKMGLAGRYFNTLEWESTIYKGRKGKITLAKK
jgi:hypothetical protein